MDKKICLITGANAGIGRAAAVQIAKEGYHVVVACRNAQRGKAAVEYVKSESGSDAAELIVVDMALQSSVRAMADTFYHKFDRLDVIISNAAAFDISQKKPIKTAEGIESIWATNQIGPVLMIDLLIPALKNSEQGRVITIASQGLMMHPRLRVDTLDVGFERRKFSVPKAYYQSKLAQVMYTYWLADQLKDTRITVNCVRVTNVKVDLNRYANLSRIAKAAYAMKSKKSISSEQMAKTYTYLATSDAVKGVTGKYFDQHNRQVESSRYSMDQDCIEAVMALTMGHIAKLG